MPPGNTTTSGRGTFGERLVDHQTQHPVVAADLTELMPDERHVDGRDALQHFVGSDRVECGEPLEQRNGYVHGYLHGAGTASVSMAAHASYASGVGWIPSSTHCPQSACSVVERAQIDELGTVG